MKSVRSLLVCIQLLAICQSLFGLLVVGSLYDDQASNVATLLQNEENYVRMQAPDYHSGLREIVERWHMHTVNVTRYWCAVSGALLFALSTGIVYLLNRPTNALIERRALSTEH